MPEKLKFCLFRNDVEKERKKWSKMEQDKVESKVFLLVEMKNDIPDDSYVTNLNSLRCAVGKGLIINIQNNCTILVKLIQFPVKYKVWIDKYQGKAVNKGIKIVLLFCIFLLFIQ